MLRNIRQKILDKIYTNAKSTGSTSGWSYALEAAESDYSSVELDDLRKGSKNDVVDRALSAWTDFAFQLDYIDVDPPYNEEPTKEEKDEIVQELETINKIIKPSLSIKSAAKDQWIYGSAIFNFVNGSLENSSLSNVPTSFKRLPPYSFSELPDTKPENYREAQFLKGIVYNPVDGTFTYTQKQKSSKVDLPAETILHVLSPTSEFPDGDSKYANINHIVKQLADIEVARMQTIRRLGAPVLCFTVEAPPTDGTGKTYRDATGKPIFVNFGDRMAEIQKVAKNQNRGSILVLPDFVKVEVLKLDNALKAIREEAEAKELKIVQYVICRDFTENQGSSLSGSSASGLEFLKLRAEGQREDIFEKFAEFYNNILKENGKEGWKVRPVWKELEPKNLLNDAMIAKAMVESGVFTENEVRETVEFPELSEEELQEKSGKVTGLEENPSTTPEEKNNATEDIKQNIKLNEEINHAVEGQLSDEELAKLIKEKPLDVLRSKQKLEKIEKILGKYIKETK
jgi:hypothetical protein